MPVTKDAPGPYAPATTTLNIIELVYTLAAVLAIAFIFAVVFGAV